MVTAGDLDGGSSPTTAKDIIRNIECWIRSEENLHSDVVQKIEIIVNRQLSRWEETWVERQYVTAVLKIWLKECLEKAFSYLENKAIDTSTEMLALFHQLDSVNSFHDIPKLNASSQLLNWCDGERFKLILEQNDPFQTTFSSVALVSNYVNHLKNWCTDKVIARCLVDIDARDKTSGKKQCDFVLALHNFFTTAHKNNTDDMQLQDIMEEESLEKDLLGDAISGKELVSRMLDKILKTKSVGSSSSKLEIRESFRRLKDSAAILEDIEWTPQLQLLTKETCKKSLLPITKATIKDEESGRRIIVVKGVSVSVGKMINKISDLQTKMKARELHIIGLNSVHVDWSLTANDWHGTNIVVVTDKLFVNGDVCWDVSGQHGTTHLNEQFHLIKGESGGNVHVVCNEMETIKDGQWTIRADGGDGGNGRNGPSLTTDNIRKWSKEKFKKDFPSMSTLKSKHHKSAMSTVIKTLDEIMPVENRDRGATKLLSHQENVYIEGTAQDGSRITVSFFTKKNQVTKKLKKRCTLILCQGSRGGQGGYGGSITFEHLNGEPFAVPSSLLIGTKKLPAIEMQTGVYQALQGKNGKAAGDVGFIHCVDITHGKKNSKEGNYIGFDNDVKLKIEYLEHKPQDDLINSYTPVNPSHAEGHRYAKIIPKENHETFDSCHYSVTEEAGRKKKAIIGQSLEQYFIQIEQRKRMTQSFQATCSIHLSSQTRQQLDDIESFVNQIENKQSLLQQQFTSQRVAEEKVGEGKYVKPTFIRRFDDNNIRNSCENMLEQTLGCRPVDFHSQPKPQVGVRCLNLLPTMDGVDSALHSIYGKKNATGIYLCRDPKRYREKIAKFIRSQEKLSQSGDIHSHDKIFTFVEQFVKWRVKNGDFPTASSMKDAYMKNNASINRESIQNYKILLKEYAQFIEFPSSTLDINEMEILTIDCNITVHIYENQLSSFKYKTTLNSAQSSDRSKVHFVLYERGGGWQRLEPNEKLTTFCNELDKAFFENSYYYFQTNYFSELIEWLGEKKFDQNVITCIKRFNPLDGETPDELSQLLMKRLEKNYDVQHNKKGKLDGEKIVQLATDLHLLSQIVLEYNNRNISPIFYLNIVSRFEPHEWKYEFLMLEIEQRLANELSYDERNDWRKNLLYRLNDNVVFLLRERILATDKQPQTSKLVFHSEKRQLEKILRMLIKDVFDLTEIDVRHLGKLPLSDWYYELRCKVWQKKIDSRSLLLKTREGKLSLKKKAVYMLVNLEMMHGEDYCRQLTDGIQDLQKVVKKLEENLVPKSKTNRWDNRKTVHTERKVLDIIFSMKNDPVNKSFERQLEDIGKKVEESKQMQLTGNQITDLISNEWVVKGIDLTDGPSLVKFLYVFDYAVRKIFHKKEQFQLRDTQRVAIMTLLTDYTLVNSSSSSGILVQVATGEGKSLIVAGVAIAFALSRLPNEREKKGKNKVDVVTSNNILAKRDSHFLVDEGGLRDLYEFFKINVSNNCSQSEYNRIKAYDSDVVYGELSNFQRDYLLDKFYNRNIRGDRTFDFIIVDEVDCMLLDRGNNTLFLSHDIPGMEMLESLYVFIWEKIHQSMKIDDIKSAVLFDLYGAITKNNLNSIHAPLKDHPSEKNALWNHLIERKVIDSNGRLLIEDVDKITEKLIDYTSKWVHSGLNHHLTSFFRKVATRERRIRIPDHLLSFVDRHLDSWLDNALRAIQLKPDEDYVVDQDRSLSRSNTSMDLEPQVIIIDPDTGIDQTSSQWDEAIHQFLQLKEGCKLTLQSLKAVFISNTTYIKLYSKITGVSGTLGSEMERKFMMGKYKFNFFNIPTAFPKCFALKPTIVYTSNESWLKAITEEARQTVCPSDRTRSIIIFCRSIKGVNIVYRHLIKNLKNDHSKIHRYTRDYEKLPFESAQLDVGNVIVATNLAGRGTDIKISPQLHRNGGLHVCLTYLPDSERVEEQAMGRSGRNGAPGSGILILYEAETVDEDDFLKAESEWHFSKVFSMKEERNFQELQRVSRLETDFNSICQQETFFDRFSQHYNQMKRLLLTSKYCNHEIKAICDSALDQWALWLDLTSEDVKSFYQSHEHDCWLAKQFETQISDCKGSLIDIEWISPSRFLTMVKNMASNQSKRANLSSFNKRLTKLIESKDSFFYPAAHYYQAFILINENIEKNKNEITVALLTCERILNEYITLQNSFEEVVDQTLSRIGSSSFCVVEAYRQQKDNVIKLLHYFIGSIWSFLGTNYISVIHLQMHTRMNQIEKAEEVFNKLTDSKLIVCNVNDPKTVPNRDAIIQKVADKYGIKRSSIDEYLNDLLANAKKSNGLKEKEMEKKLKYSKMIANSRKEFWNFLVANEVLENPIECGIISQSDCDKISLDRNDSNERIKLKPASFDSITVFYDPTCTIQTDLQEKKKIMFKKSYVKKKILEYRKNMPSLQEPTYESNKYACLNLAKLKLVNLKSFGRLKKSEFAENDYLKINRNELANIWNELRNQNIIDDKGDLASDYTGHEFRYPECPNYEDSVNRLIKMTFAVELVRRDWLKTKENPRYLLAITQLPLKPYRELMHDFYTVHAVSGPRVNVNSTLDLKKVVKIIEDRQECESVIEFLETHRPSYVSCKNSGAFLLDSIERDIRASGDMSNISSELYIFGLMGFDHAIKTKDQKTSWMAISAILMMGIFQLAVGIGTNRYLRHITRNPGVGGLQDILFLIKSLRNNQTPTMAGYRRYKIRKIILDSFQPISQSDVFESWLVNPEQRQENYADFFKRSENKKPSVTLLDVDAATSHVSENQIKMNLIDQIKANVNRQLHEQCHLYGTELKKKMTQVVVKNSDIIKETLSHLYRLNGQEGAQRLVNEKMCELATNLFQRGQKKSSEWLSKVDEAIKSELSALNTIRGGRGQGKQMLGGDLLSQIINQVTETTNQMRDLRIEITHLIVESMRTFHLELKKTLETTSQQNCNTEEREISINFENKVIADMKSEITEKVDRIIELMAPKLRTHVTNNFTLMKDSFPQLFEALSQMNCATDDSSTDNLQYDNSTTNERVGNSEITRKRRNHRRNRIRNRFSRRRCIIM